MALRTNRFNAQSNIAAVFPGNTEAWAIRRIDLLKNLYASQASVDDLSGVPNGYNTGALLLPLKAGGMSSYNPAILNLVAANADAKMGRNLEASASLSIVVSNAQADQIVSFVASGTLSISAGNAGLSAGVQAVASGTLAITGDLSLGGIIPVSASAACSLDPDVDMSALAFMEAEAGGATPLSPEGLASAVWSAVAADNNDSGTMGEKLNDAGSAGNPWASELASNTSDGTFGQHVQKLLKKTDFIGLK